MNTRHPDTTTKITGVSHASHPSATSGPTNQTELVEFGS